MHPIAENSIERVRNMLAIRDNFLHNITYWITFICIVWSIVMTLIVIKMDQDILNRDVLIIQQERTIAKWIDRCSPKPSKIANR